jgi:hypothetical protein
VSAIVFAVSFIALYAGHMVGDFLAQTHAQSLGKAQPHGWLPPMLGHLAGYGTAQVAALLAVFWTTGVHTSPNGMLAGIGFSLLTHGFIDRRWPVKWLLEHTGSKEFAALASRGVNGMYLADQSLHVGCLFVAALIMGGLS